MNEANISEILYVVYGEVSETVDCDSGDSFIVECLAKILNHVQNGKVSPEEAIAVMHKMLND